MNIMPRPRKTRRIWFKPDVTYYKPAGIPVRELESVSLTKEEIEALRLKDVEGLSQEDAAERMHISQPTFNRALTSARKKVSEAIIKGKAIEIQSD